MDLAVAALIVSGATLLWTIGWSVYTNRQATKPHVIVRQSLGFTTYGPHAGDRAS